jgi:hypothetical protein
MSTAAAQQLRVVEFPTKFTPIAVSR